jgi:hypothetical protein
MIALPEPPNVDFKVPLCHMLIEPLKLEECTLKTAKDMSGHILVCTGDLNVFKFVCSMRYELSFFRSAHRGNVEHIF